MQSNEPLINDMIISLKKDQLTIVIFYNYPNPALIDFFSYKLDLVYFLFIWYPCMMDVCYLFLKQILFRDFFVCSTKYHYYLDKITSQLLKYFLKCMYMSCYSLCLLYPLIIIKMSLKYFFDNKKTT